MALKIRQGLEVDRSGVTPAEGELIYTTDEKLVYIGDGVTPGGNIISSGSSTLTVKDQGSTLTTSPISINFAGDGVTATTVGDDITVTIPGGGGAGGGSMDSFSITGDDSVPTLIEDGTTITFTGSGGNSVYIDEFGSVNIVGSGSIINPGETNRLAFYETTSSILSDTGAGLTWDGATLDVNLLNSNALTSDNANFAIIPTATQFVTLGGYHAGSWHTGKLQNLDLDGYDPFNPNTVLLYQVHNQQPVNALNFLRARGTVDAELGLEQYDSIGGILFNGRTDAAGNTGQAAAIYVLVAEPLTPATTVVPGIMALQTTNSSGVLSNAIIIDQYQTVNILASAVFSNQIKISGNQIETIDSNANLDIRTNGTGVINLLEDTSVSGVLTVSGTLNVSTVDTTDSSAITFTPAVVFESDVTIENDLIVTNRVYASEFISTNTGDPEIYSSTDLDITVGLKTYTLASNGGLQMPILSAAPASPVIGATYVADNSGWDPASKPGTAPYPVFWDGVTYQALY